MDCLLKMSHFQAVKEFAERHVFGGRNQEVRFQVFTPSSWPSPPRFETLTCFVSQVLKVSPAPCLLL